MYYLEIRNSGNEYGTENQMEVHPPMSLEHILSTEMGLRIDIQN